MHNRFFRVFTGAADAQRPQKNISFARISGHDALSPPQCIGEVHSGDDFGCGQYFTLTEK